LKNIENIEMFNIFTKNKTPDPIKQPPPPQEKIKNNNQNKLLIKELEELIVYVKEGNKKIIGDSKGESKGILILGETGVGKSSLAYLFAGRKLQVKKSVENDYYIDCKDQQPLFDIKISHQKVSQTIIPGKIKMQDGFVVWDCPGFGDIGRNATQDIANAFYIQRLFESSEDLKFVLILPEYHLKDRAQNAVRMFEIFASMFERISDLKGSVCLLLTNVDPQKDKKAIWKSLSIIIEVNKKLTSKAKELINFFSDGNFIEIFYTINQEGELPIEHYDHIFEGIKKNLKYFKTKSCKVDVVISESSLPLAKNFLKVTLEALFKLIENFEAVFSSSCIDNCRIIDQINDLFYRDQLQITLVEPTPYLREYLLIESLISLGNSLNYLLEKEDFDEFFSRVNKTIKTTLMLMSQFRNKSDAVSNPFSSQLEREKFEEQIKDISNRMRFLMKILNPQDLTPGFEEISKKFVVLKELLYEFLTNKVKNLKIAENEKRTLYYDKIIEFLTNYEEDPEIQKKISFCHYCLAKILFQKKLLDDAIINAINSFVYNNINEEVLLFLDKIFDGAREKLKTLKSENQNEIIDYLFEMNLKKIQDLLQKAKINLKIFFIENQKYDNFVFIDKGLEILKKLMILLKIPICNNKILEAFELIAGTLDIFEENTDLSNSIMNQADYLQKIYNLKPNQNFEGKLKDSINILDLEEEFKKVLFEQIKKIEFGELEKGLYPQEKFEKVLEYTEFMKRSMKNDKDGVMFWMQRQIYNGLGNKNLKTNDFAEAAANFIKSIEIDPHQNPAYEGLEALYFLGLKSNIEKKKEIVEELLQLGFREFEVLFKKRVLCFVMDFVGERDLYKQNLDDLEYVIYLETILMIYDLIKDFYGGENRNDPIKTFLLLLEKIEEKMEPFAEGEIINEKLEQEPKVVVERHFKPEFSYFAINLFAKQLGYIKHLCTVELKQDMKQVQELLNASVDSLEHNAIFKAFRDKLNNLEISFSETNHDYYIRIIGLLEKIKGVEPMVFKDLSMCFLRIGDMAKEAEKIDDAISNYEQALDYIDLFHVFCQEKELFKLYKQSSRKREIVLKTGDLLFSKENYKHAYEIYKKIKDHNKIKQCFKKLKNTDQEDASFMEEKGDYYYEMGLIDKSVESYHEARSLSISPEDVVRLYKKIGNALSSYGQKAFDFKEMAQSVDQYGIIE